MKAGANIAWLFRRAAAILLLWLAPATGHGQVWLNNLPPHITTNWPAHGEGLGRFHAGPGHWTIEGGVPQGVLGKFADGPADFNRDGRPEIVIAAPRFPGKRGEQWSGKVWCLTVETNPPGLRPVWSYASTQLLTELGAGLAVGDFNGDGFQDLAVGAMQWAGGGPLMVFSGSSTGLSLNPVWDLRGRRHGGDIGRNLLAGDVNRDGYGDLLVGSSTWRTNLGGVFIFCGSPTGLPFRATFTLPGVTPAERFGANLALLDVNGDQRLDLAVSASWFDRRRGCVRLLLGTNGAGANAPFMSAPAWMATGSQPGADFGRVLAGMGDLDKNGCDELGIGMPRARAPSSTKDSDRQGMACIYFGTRNGLGAEPGWQAYGAETNQAFGSALACVGDVNGDGWLDVLAGGPGHTRWGRANLYLGSRTGLPTTRSWLVSAGGWFMGTGSEVAPLGDLNGDGLTDFGVASATYGRGDDPKTQSGRVDFFFGRREGYAPGEAFPMDGSNSWPGVNAVEEFNAQLANLNDSRHFQAMLDVSKGLSNVMGETRALESKNTKARRWLQGLAWAAGPLMVALAFLWRWQRRRVAATTTHRERERLARDLHDGLGSGVHRLQRLTELLNLADPNSPEARQHREDLLKTAQELGGSMDRTIWAVKPENDTLENFVSYLAGYAPTLLEPHGIACELDFPPSLPAVRFQGETRQQLFLAVNEALNNVARHSHARRAWLRLTQRDGWTEFVIEDDGGGMPVEGKARAGGGNGLKNQRLRMEEVGGSCEVQARPGGGVRVALRFRSPAAG